MLYRSMGTQTRAVEVVPEVVEMGLVPRVLVQQLVEAVVQQVRVLGVEVAVLMAVPVQVLVDGIPVLP
jgi:hypothetical protein